MPATHPRLPRSRLLLVVAALPLSLSFAAAAGATELPRLGVIIAIDQCRADYLERFRPYFGDGGFRRLLDDGRVYANCHYRHAATKTAVGHATIATGAHPEVHGVVANDWLDRSRWLMMASVEDREAPLVGAAERAPGSVFAARAGRSPRNLRASTIGDQLKLRYGDRARVFGVANKDRSAILLGGHLADGAFWLGDENRFVSSRYYRPDGTLPAWVGQFNADHPLESFFGRTWDRLIEAAAYDAVQGPDDAPGEFSGLGLGRTFPRKLDGGRAEISNESYDAFDNSPFALELVGDFARALLVQEKLGADDVPDLLCIGFSQIDTMGHNYGPDSHELMDSMLRLDRVIAGLLGFLDDNVGRGRYVVAISADHGVAPLPERVQSTGRGLPAGRVNMGDLDRAIAVALDHEFGPPPEGDTWVTRDNSSYHLRVSTLTAKKLTVAQTAPVVAAALRATPTVVAVFTADELHAGPAEGDSLPAMLRRSLHPGRTGDVHFVLAPYHMDKRGTGTTHGSPYDYDTHVPMVWFGAGVPPGMHLERVGVDDLAPTLCALLGVPRPPEAQGRRLF